MAVDSFFRSYKCAGIGELVARNRLVRKSGNTRKEVGHNEAEGLCMQ